MFAGNSSRKRKAVTSLSGALKKAKVGVVTSKSKSLTSKVNKLIRHQELKFRDNLPGMASNFIVAGALLSQTALVAQGDDAVARDGRRITMKYYHIHGWYTNTTGANGGSRVIVYLDKQSNGSSFAVTDVLVSTTPTADSMINFINRDRFKILWDSYAGSGTQTISDNAGAGVYPYYVNKYIPLNDVEAVYASNVTAEAITNAVGYLVIGPVAQSYLFNTRLVFTDA